MSDHPRQGRPPTIEPRPGEKSMLSILASPELKARILGASAASGRSLSTEGERRLDITFIAEDVLDQGLRLAWGSNAELIFLFGEWVNYTDQKGEWESDVGVNANVALGLRHVLDVLFDPENTPIEKLGGGARTAQYFLYLLSNPNSPWAAPKRARLGHLVPLIDRRADVIDRALAERGNPLEQGASDAQDQWAQSREPLLRAAAERRARETLEKWETVGRRARARHRREKPEG